MLATSSCLRYQNKKNKKKEKNKKNGEGRKDEKKCNIQKERKFNGSIQISLKIIRNRKLGFIKLSEDTIGWNRVKT